MRSMLMPAILLAAVAAHGGSGAAPAASAEVPAGAAEGTGAVTYIPARDVSAGFEKGSVLFAGPAYMIHASRREAAGQAEVHVRDTDIIYVLGGAATFVTGGAAEDARPIAPDEIRGASIRGGETRRLAKGDVMIVPNGVVHWFKEVQGPFLYYVVKVRDAKAGAR